MLFFFLRNRHREYLSLYNINLETKAYMIEVSLEDYAELFNGWDASPSRRREVEPELMDYFEQAAAEIPLKAQTEIRFSIPAERRDTDKERKCTSALMNNFRVKRLFAEKALSDINSRLVTYVAISATLLTLSHVASGVGQLSLVYQIMVEGMVIGGWWILWEGCSLFFFTGRSIRAQRAYFERYLNSRVTFEDSCSHPDKEDSL